MKRLENTLDESQVHQQILNDRLYPRCKPIEGEVQRI